MAARKKTPSKLRSEVRAAIPTRSSSKAALKLRLQTKLRSDDTRRAHVEREQVEKAARVLLAGDGEREANPIVVDAVATIMQRVADHAYALEFGVNGAQRVAAAEALERVQELLVKLAQAQRAEFVEHVADHAQRLQALPAARDSEDDLALARDFIESAAPFDRTFRRLDETYVVRELSRLRSGRPKRGQPVVGAAEVAGALSAKVWAFNDRTAKKAANAFEKACTVSKRAVPRGSKTASKTLTRENAKAGARTRKRSPGK